MSVLTEPYDDLTDTLCVWTIASVGFARIGPVGSDLPYVEAADGDTRCTGNLSIPEDAYWRITFEWRGAVVEQVAGVSREDLEVVLAEVGGLARPA